MAEEEKKDLPEVKLDQASDKKSEIDNVGSNKKVSEMLKIRVIFKRVGDLHQIMCCPPETMLYLMFLMKEICVTSK